MLFIFFVKKLFVVGIDITFSHITFYINKYRRVLWEHL